MSRKSWVESANVAGCDFPLAHLPWGRFERADMPGAWHLGVAIGDRALDMTRLPMQVCARDWTRVCETPCASRR
jgi:fumarylacetoacetase